jgi:hypothetical protein
MANVVAVALFVVGFVVVFSSLLIWTACMLPRPVARAQSQLESHPWRSLIVGFAVLATGLGVYFVALSFRSRLVEQLGYLFDRLAESTGTFRITGDAGTVAHNLLYLVLTPFLIALVIGGAAFATLFARRVDVSGTGPIKGLIGGAFAMSAAMFVPLIGWFILTPIMASMAAGAGLVALVTRDR